MSHQSISQIALAAGFKDLSHFSHAYRARFVSGVYCPPSGSAGDGRRSDLDLKGWTHAGHRAFAQI
jgi:AraC-like DNA-binding protein